MVRLILQRSFPPFLSEPEVLNRVKGEVLRKAEQLQLSLLPDPPLLLVGEGFFLTCGLDADLLLGVSRLLDLGFVVGVDFRDGSVVPPPLAESSVARGGGGIC